MAKIKKRNLELLKPGPNGKHLQVLLIIIRLEAVKDSVNSEFALAFALIENHYFVNKGFLEIRESTFGQYRKDKRYSYSYSSRKV